MGHAHPTHNMYRLPPACHRLQVDGKIGCGVVEREDPLKLESKQHCGCEDCNLLGPIPPSDSSPRKLVKLQRCRMKVIWSTHHIE